jgi:hypothetical protein
MRKLYISVWIVLGIVCSSLARAHTLLLSSTMVMCVPVCLPLLQALMAEDPTQRPSAEELVKMSAKLTSKQALTLVASTAQRKSF